MFVDLFTLHRRAKQGLGFFFRHFHSNSRPLPVRERKLQRALLSVASSLLHATNEKTVYLPSHSHANYQTRPVPHADQVVPCMCCTVYSQLTCPLSNPDNLFGIGLYYRQASRHTEVRFVHVTSPAAGLLELPS